MDKSETYGTTAKVLHWLLFALVAAQFAIAWTMPDIGRDSRPEGLIGWHLSLGVLIMLLALIRLLWRLSHPVPLLEAQPRWQRALARLVHVLLYGILLLLPVLGWGNASSRGWDVTLFGLVRLPPLVNKGSAFGHELGDIHAAGATVLLILVGLHAAAAFYHHFVVKDRTLARMMPDL